MRKLILLLLSVISVEAYSQKGEIRGEVIDYETAEPLPGVNVLIDGTPLTATNKAGEFEITLEYGIHTIELRYVSYQTYRGEIEVNADLSDEKTRVWRLKPEEKLLNQIVVSAGKKENRIKNVTVSMDLLDIEEIRSQQSITLDDALERASGINVIDGQPNIRGGSGYSYGAGSRVMLLMNGLPILRADAGFPPWNYLPLENADQVEVIKGASSVLYGSAALNGIINLRTAWPTDTASTRISFYSGVYDKPADNRLVGLDSMFDNGTLTGVDSTIHERAWWDGNIPYFSGANFVHKQQFGQFDVVAGGDAFLEESYLQDNYVRRIRGNVSLRYRPKSTNWIFGLHANGMRNRNASFFFWEDDSSGVYKPFQGTITHSNSTLYNIDPFIHYYGEKGWKHSLQGRYFVSDIFTNDGKGTLNDIYYGEYEIQKDFSSIGLKINGGLVGNYNTVDAELYGDTIHQSTNQAAYFQLDKSFFQDHLRIIAGVRYERNTIDDLEPKDRFVSRFGLNYQPGEFTFLRASFGQGYRFPTIAEKFVNTNVGAINIFENPGLQSEVGWSAEIGMKQGFKIGDVQGYADAAVFYNTYQDMMEFVFGARGGSLGFSSQNVGDTEIKGFEVMLLGEGRIGKGNLRFSTGYTYIDPIYLDWDSTKMELSSVNYNVLKYRSKHMFKLNTGYEIGKFNFGLHGRYYSQIEAVDRIFELLLPGIGTYRANNQDGDWIFDFSAGFDLSSMAQIELNVNNLFSNVYSFRPGLMEAPRSIAVRMNVRF